MKKQYYMKGVFSLLLGCSLVFSGCSLFEPDPDNIYDEERVKSDPSFAEGLLLKAYQYIPAAHPYTEVATDDAATNSKTDSYRLLAEGEWSEHNNPTSLWGCYTGITYANRFLKYVDQVPWSTESPRRYELFRARYKGEALALRALLYYNLLKVHGGYDANGELLGVPYFESIIDLTDEAQWKVKRLPYKECIEAMFKDLNEAIALLPYDYVNKYISGTNNDDDDYNRVCGIRHKNRISGRIAQGIKARIALMAASPAYNNGVYDLALCDTAVKAAGAVLNNIGGISQLADGGKLNDYIYWDKDDDIDNVEVIWRMDYSSSYSKEKECFPPSMSGNGRISPSHDFVNTFSMKTGEPIKINSRGQFESDPTTGFDANNPYTDRDPRMDQIVIYNGSTVFGSPLDFTTGKPDATSASENSTVTGYYLRKNLRMDASVESNSAIAKRHVYPLMRYTELFLIYAEALNQLKGADGKAGYYDQDPSAREVINAIRQRGGITKTDYIDGLSAADFTLRIQEERRIELSFEGFRFWDLRRWQLDQNKEVKGLRIQKTSNVYSYSLIPKVNKRNYQEFMIYGPIPYSERVKNPLLDQNNGW